MTDLYKLRSALTVLALITCLSVMIGLPIVYAKQVTIQVDIDAAGTVTLTPNPTHVADGDTVTWHIRTGTPDRGFKLTLPHGPNSPFGNRDHDIIIEIAPALPGGDSGPQGPIKWPAGVTEYEYRAESFPPVTPPLSAASNYTEGWLVKESSVGGITVPVDRFGLLAPYIGLTSTIIGAVVATAIYAKRVKRKKEKQ
jgi:hypothetical protein